MPMSRLRRLTKIAQDIASLDLGRVDSSVVLATIKQRCVLALQDGERSRGNAVNLDEARRRAKEARVQKAIGVRKTVRPIIGWLRSQGFTSYEAIADQLNEMEIASPNGRDWSRGTVRAIEVKDYH